MSVDIPTGFNGFFTNIVKEYLPAIDESASPPTHEKSNVFVDSKVFPEVKLILYPPPPHTAKFCTKGVTQFRPTNISRDRWGIIKDTKSGCPIYHISCYNIIQLLSHAVKTS